MCLITLIFLTLSGCDRNSRHRVLNVFFTGVPPLEEEKTITVESEPAPQQKIVQTIILSSHSYFTEKKCDACHQTSITVLFNRGNRTSPSVSSNFPRESPGKLKLPPKEICISCHEDKSLEYAKDKGLEKHVPVFTHAPVECNFCHVPHQSEQPHLLRETPFELCTQCHSDVLMNKCEFSPEKPVCLECHNPHLGTNTLLLREDYLEQKLPLNPHDLAPIQ